MNNIKYEEDSEDIDFPPIKFSPDIIYKDKNPKKDFCSKLKKFCNQKKNINFFINWYITFYYINDNINCLFDKKEK